ncbi:hypothetical protein F4805DRAFT_410032 [Annulohypoxylon moriforme]|nr:hypothetical protein F4805DRAFT_410032 [Annulohypoxylon moriforme]
MADSSNACLAIPLNEIRSHNRNNTTQSSDTPYRPQTPMQQQNSYSTMFDRVENARVQAGHKPYGFYTDEDVIRNSPTGWPSLAATQAYFSDHSSQRIFKASTKQSLTWLQQKIYWIDNKLDEMNFKDGEAEEKPLRSLPFDEEKFIDRCIKGIEHLPLDSCPEGKPDRAAQRENLIRYKDHYLKEYFTLFGMCRENEKLPRVSRRAHEAHFERIQRYDKLDNKALAFMRHIDDFVSDAPDDVFRKFESILYARSERARKFIKRISCIFCRSSLPAPEPDDPRTTYRKSPFRFFIKAILVLSCQSLLVVPVSLLYIQTDWSRGSYLGIVIGCSTAFAVVMSYFVARTERMLVGLAAYLAVLVAFLANLPGCVGRAAE